MYNKKKLYSKRFIITLSDFDKNTTSKRKGDGFEGLIWRILFKGGSLSVEKQQTIKKAIELYTKRFYKVRKKFDLIQNSITKNFSRDFKNGDILFNKNSVLVNHELKLCYRKDKKNIEVKFSEREQLVKYLMEESLISETKPPTIIQKFRMDSYKVKDDKIYLIECKNKEKSYLRKRDLNQIVTYGRIIKECLPLGDIKVIINGYSKDWSEELEIIRKIYGIEITIYNIKSWLVKFAETTGKKIDCLVYSKIKLNDYGFEPIKVWKKSKFFLNVHFVPYNPSENYKPIPLVISDNLDSILKHIQKRIGVTTK